MVDVNVNVMYTGFMPQSAAQKDRQITWSIQDFAREFEVTPRTIRFYEAKGLLSPARQSGARYFIQEDHVRLSEIMRAKRLGFSLEDIKIVMDVIDGKIRDKATLLEHKNNFEVVIKNLGRKRKDIDSLTKDMADICAQIDQHIETETENSGDSEIANAYHAAFRRHLQT